MLLLQQKDADDALRGTVNAEIADAAARAEKRRKDERDAVILAMLLAASERMGEAIAARIVLSRQAARAAARGRLGAELKAAGIVLAAHEWALHSRKDEDDGYADHAASSLAGQWRGLAIAAILGAERKERTPAEAIRSTGAPMRLRSSRTAETEIARAYADEHSEALSDIVEHDRHYRDGELADAIETRLMRQWSALVDACPRCWPLHGVEVGIGESFPGGEEPGYVHVRCRCIEVVVAREESVRTAA